MNLERMRWLREAVETAPEDGFAMSTWSNACGTVRCAAGWLCADPRVLAAGLELRRVGVHFFPVYNDKDNYKALADFLDIGIDETIYLFDQYGNPTTKEDALRRIDCVMASS